MRFLIIGGSDAGISAALRAREVNPNAEIALVLEDEFPNYSICGLPFFLSGETPDWKTLAHRTEFDGISIYRKHRAEHIDTATKKVKISTSKGEVWFDYDKLLIATGARPVRPSISGWNLPGVFPLHTMHDSFAVRDYLETVRPSRAVIVGAGYIGLEMADALTHRGIEVVVAGRTPTVLATVDSSFGEAVRNELERHGVIVRTGVDIHTISSVEDHLHVSGNNFDEDCDLVLVAVGVSPNVELGTAIGIPTGARGALQVNRRMETGIADVYVAGDCGETWHRLLSRHTYLPLGTTAHKQGRVAGENAVGGEREFAGSLGTQVVKIFDLVIARTGLRPDEARTEGIDAVTTEVAVNDHKAYYPGATTVHCRVTGDAKTGRLVGAQIMGTWGAEISKRNDIFAAALFNDMTVDRMLDLDLSYTPPLSSPWDPVQMACQAWSVEHAAKFRES